MPTLTHEMNAVGRGRSGDGWAVYPHAVAFRMDGGPVQTREGVVVSLSQRLLSLSESALLSQAIMDARAEIVALSTRARAEVEEPRASDSEAP